MNQPENSLNSQAITLNSGKGGPKTPEGKRRSSLNALKHGLTAKSPQAFEIILRDCEACYREIHDNMQAYYRPADPVEKELVKRIAVCAWRLARIGQMEKRLLCRNPDPSRPSTSLERVAAYERPIDLQLHRAIRSLAIKRESDKNSFRQNEPYPRSFSR